MSVARDDHSCGRTDNRIVVVGGYSEEASRTSEIFSLDSLTWATGPGVPSTPNGKFFRSEVYQLEDAFDLLGGYDGSNYLDTVFEFDPEGFTWKLRDERLDTGRYLHANVHIPNRVLGA